MTPLKFLNTRGIPAIESINVTTVGTVTTITFRNHPYVNSRFAGGFWVKIGQTIATGGNTIQFATDGVSNSTMSLYLPDGDEATAANVVSDGNAVHLCFYDSDTKRLTLVA